jgi:hypothetical protein
MLQLDIHILFFPGAALEQKSAIDTRNHLNQLPWTAGPPFHVILAE